MRKKQCSIDYMLWSFGFLYRFEVHSHRFPWNDRRFSGSLETSTGCFSNSNRFICNYFVASSPHPLPRELQVANKGHHDVHVIQMVWYVCTTAAAAAAVIVVVEVEVVVVLLRILISKGPYMFTCFFYGTTHPSLLTWCLRWVTCFCSPHEGHDLLLMTYCSPNSIISRSSHVLTDTQIFSHTSSCSRACTIVTSLIKQMYLLSPRIKARILKLFMKWWQRGFQHHEV